MNRFKWWRRFKGGYWVLYDMSGYISDCADAWIQVEPEEWVPGPRAKKFEQYVVKEKV